MSVDVCALSFQSSESVDVCVLLFQSNVSVDVCPSRLSWCMIGEEGRCVNHSRVTTERSQR